MEVDRANKETACPYCGVDRAKPATRQYRCKACGETVYVKRTPDSDQKRPMTYEQAKEAEKEWELRQVDKERVRYQNTLRSQVVHQLMLYLRYPKCHHFRIYIDDPCINCSPLNQKLFRLNNHNIKNIPLPNSDCLDASEIGYHCQSGIEAVFDDELTADDLANAIIEYKDDRIIDITPSNRLSQPDTFMDSNSNTPQIPTPSEQSKIEAIKLKAGQARQKKILERVKTGEKHHRHDGTPEIKAAQNQTKWGIIFLLIFIPSLITIKSLYNPAQQQTPEQDAALTQQIETYLQNNFGKPRYTASWYPMILHSRISHQPAGNIIEVVTILDKTDKQAAKNICSAISGYWANHQSQIDGLRIIGNSQKIISYRYSLGGGCG